MVPCHASLSVWPIIITNMIFGAVSLWLSDIVAASSAAVLWTLQSPSAPSGSLEAASDSDDDIGDYHIKSILWIFK